MLHRVFIYFRDTRHRNVTDVVATPSDTVTVTVVVPGLVIVPLINPDELLI